MLVRELIDLLQQREEAETLSPSQQSAVNQLVTILAPHQDMELQSLFDLFRRAISPKLQTRAGGQPDRAGPTVAKQTASEFVHALRTSFNDDAAFNRLISEAKPNRALTLALLKSAFADLFGRPGNFRSKATRDDVLRKILDERNIKVRNEKMGQMLGRKPVAAE